MLDRALPEGRLLGPLVIGDFKAASGFFESILALVDRLVGFKAGACPASDGTSSSSRGHAIAEERRRSLRRAGARRLYFIARLTRKANVNAYIPWSSRSAEPRAALR